MTDRVLKILEYDKILAAAAKHASSELGRERVLSTRPFSDFDSASAALTETDEALSILAIKPTFPLCGFSDITAEIKRLKSKAPLNCAELLRVNSVLKAAKRASEGVRGESAPRLTTLANGLAVLDYASRSIDSAIISDEEVADGASRELTAIRRKMAREQDSIKDRLNAILKSSAKYLQDSIITIRGGRYVVPVRQEYRGSVPGLVHDQSGSGATLFIEPMSVVEANNRLRELGAEEQAEIERILARLSAELYPYTYELAQDLSILTHLDAVFCRALYSRSIKGVLPKLNTEGVTDIREGRHPLIDPKKVVSVTVKLGEGYRALVVTGPNTGGKTVTLKLVGLLALMAQSGFFVPCENGTRLSVYSDVLADIGDEQSIEQSLSTFSSHMKNITGILDRAGERSLVLLDELGAGTDPAEGAALAASILEELKYRRASVVATTHYSEIKAFALNDGYFENAGMEFDPATLSPTYRLFIGIPGMSNAFLISERLGLDPAIIERARAHMSEERLRFERVLSEAERERSEAQAKSRELDELLIRIRADEEAAAKLLDEARADKARRVEKAREEAASILRDASDEAELLIAELKELKNAAALDDRAITQAAASVRQGLDKARKKHDKPKKRRTDPPPAAGEITLGADVRIVSLDADATVLSLPDAKGALEVQAGVMKLKTNISDIELIKKKQAKVSHTVSLSGKTAKPSIDLRGMTLEEAIMEVDMYLDSCVMSKLNEVTIIHGRGTGVLMNGIRAHLKNVKCVKQFRAGLYGEGDMGVTVVTLK